MQVSVRVAAHLYHISKEFSPELGSYTFKEIIRFIHQFICPARADTSTIAFWGAAHSKI